jgi:glutamate-1-semialdehyde aminotransferase
MTTTTAERRELHQAIDSLADDRIVVALDFVRSLHDEQPNTETAAVIADAFAGNVGRARTRKEFFEAMHRDDTDEGA